MGKIQYKMKPNSNWERAKNHFLFSSQLFPLTVLIQILCWTLLNVKKKTLGKYEVVIMLYASVG